MAKNSLLYGYDPNDLTFSLDTTPQSFSNTAPYTAPSFQSSGFDMSNAGNFINAGGSVLKGFGALQKGKDTKRAYDYNADLTLQDLTFQLDDITGNEQDILGVQKAMIAKRGVELSGSPLDLMVKSASNAEMDRQIARYNAESKANMLRYQGALAKSQGEFDAGMSFISGGLNLAMAFI